MRRWLHLILPILLIASSVFGARYLMASRPTVTPVEREEPPLPVRVTTAEPGARQQTIEVFGEIVARRPSVIRPLVTGRVVEVGDALVEGGEVDEGALLIKIDPFDYEAALDDIEARVAETRARRRELTASLEAETTMLPFDKEQATLRREDVERLQRLASSRAASQSALDEAKILLSAQRSAVSQREQTIATVQARIEQIDAELQRLAIERRRAERDLTDTALTAPFDALVADVEVSLGKQLSAGDTVATLIERASLEVAFVLPDEAFGRLWSDSLLGRAVEARWRLGTSEYALEAEISRVGARIEPDKGGVPVYAEITGNSDDAPLRPGAFVTVRVPDRAYPDAVAVPLSALYNGNTVYVVNEAGEAVARNVEILAANGAEAVLRGELPEGARIVTSRSAELAEGSRVAVAD